MTEGGSTVDTPVEDPGLGIKVEGVDISFDAGGIKLGVEGVADEAVVGGGTGVDTVDVERTATGGVLGSTAGFITGGVLEMIAFGGVVDTTGASSGTALETAPSGATPYTGTFSSHGNVGHTAVTRAQWMKRMLKMPNGNWVSRCIPSVGFRMEN